MFIVVQLQLLKVLQYKKLQFALNFMFTKRPQIIKMNVKDLEDV